MKICLFLTLMCALGNAYSVEFDRLSWRSVVDENDLTIFVAAVPGSSVQAFRAVAKIKAPHLEVASAITDVPSFEEWVYGARHAVTLKVEGNKQWCYYENEIPWPYENRDVVFIQDVVIHSDKELSIIMSSDSEFIENKENLTRVPKLSGAWHLLETTEQSTQLTYELFLHPGGSLPAWIVNMMLAEAPKNTLSNLQEFDFSRYTKLTPTITHALSLFESHVSH
ncbi:MAG: START domain-containing protein [Pseudomonadales bacterium]|nr:START domain-containing protein [Pseudomonadales bacterium]